MIRLLALDVDGVLTDGRIHYSDAGETLKSFHAHDGLGLKLIAAAGIEVAVISGRGSAPLERRLDDLGIERRFLHTRDKAPVLSNLAQDLGIPLEACAFMGDDLPDLAPMARAGYALAPANAVQAVRDAADYVSPLKGGEGAVRDACDHLLARAGTDVQASLARWRVGKV